MRLNRRDFERRIHGMMVGCRLLVLSGIVLGAVGCGGNSVVRDFSLSVGPSVALTAGGATQPVTVTVTAISGFSSTVTCSTGNSSQL